MKTTLTILGITLCSLSRKDVLDRIHDMLVHGHGHLIVTPNPEFLLIARRSESFRHILNGADLSLPDGFGLTLAGLVKGGIINRWPGSDFPDILFPEAVRMGARIYLLGGSKGVAEEASAVFAQRFPGLKIVGAESGGVIEQRVDGQWQMDPTLLQRIRSASPEILLVALGQRKQEMWIVDHREQLPSVRIAMGVGGMFDYWSGRVSRAPHWMRRIGCEWVWRLIQQPNRVVRILNAVIVFPIVFIYDDIIKGFGAKKSKPVSR